MLVRGREESKREPDARLVHGRYTVAHWSQADGADVWEVSRCGCVIARCTHYGEALAAIAAHQVGGEI
jgi:hypothetical protein